MLVTLALVILSAAIFVFFSQEFVKFFKKIFALQGAKIILPIALASCLVYKFNGWVLWALYYCSEVLEAIKSFLTYLIPFQIIAEPLAAIVILTVFSLGPIYLLNIWALKKTYKPYPYPYLTSFIIWFVLFMLLEVM